MTTASRQILSALGQLGLAVLLILEICAHHHTRQQLNRLFHEYRELAARYTNEVSSLALDLKITATNLVLTTEALERCQAKSKEPDI